MATDPTAPYDTAVNAMNFRWARNLKIRDLEVFWEKPALDKWESALHFEDIEDLELDRFSGRPAWPEKDGPVLFFGNVTDAVIRDTRALKGTKLFLQLTGKDSRNVVLRGNDFRSSATPYRLDSTVSKDAVSALDNLLPAKN